MSRVSVTAALEAFGHEPPRRGKLRCPLPGHEDRRPGASVYTRGGIERWHCFVCNTGGSVIDLIQLTLNVEPAKATRILAREFGIIEADVKPSTKRRIPPKESETDWTAPGGGQGDDMTSYTKVEAYHYLDADGTPLFDVVRFEPKTFRARVRKEDGSFTWNLDGIKRVLYRLPEVAWGIAEGRPIYVVEGERDVHAAMERGLVATCNPGGAGKWRPEYSETLKGAHVVVVADNDEPGRKHARDIGAALEGVSMRVELMRPAVGKDLRDHFDAGLGIEDLAPLTQTPKKAKKFSIAV